MTEQTTTPELRFPEFDGKWEEKQLNNIVDSLKGNSNDNEELPVLTISAKKGWLNQKERFSQVIAGNSLSKYNELKKGDLSYNKGNSKVALYGIVYKLNFDRALVPNVYKSFRPKSNYESDFIEKYFHTKILDKQLRKLITSTARMDGLLNISDNDFYSILINIPTKKEQQKIGEFFSKLDRQIELEEQKLAKLEEQKKGYMQKIFSQELRFKDKNGNEYPKWEVIKLKDILSERKEYASKIGNYPHATLSTSGISLKSDRYNRDFLVKDKNKKYKVTIMNDICYNPANLKFGVITRNHIGSVIFSPIYITFEVNNAHSPLFIELLVTRNDFINRVRKYEEGTVYERMAVKPEDFLNYETKIPCLEEQEKIGDFFSKLDEVINKQSQKIDELKLRKQGFLQKMFV